MDGESVFKEFWDNKRHIIEIVGMLIAIGALFLNIRIPEDSIARTALFNMQLIWITIISVSILVLFMNFWHLAILIEKNIDKKYSLDLNSVGTISGIIGVIVMWFLINQWKYIISLYKSELIDFLKNLSGIFVIFCALIISNCEKKEYKNLYLNGKKTMLYLSSLLTCVFIGAFSSFILEIMDFKFDFSSFFKIFLINFIIFLICFYGCFFLDIKISNKKRNRSDSSPTARNDKKDG